VVCQDIQAYQDLVVNQEHRVIVGFQATAEHRGFQVTAVCLVIRDIQVIVVCRVIQVCLDIVAHQV